MTKALILFLLSAAPALVAQDAAWPPAADASRAKDLPASERTMEIFQHGIRPSWGYESAQQDHFVVVHPTAKRENAPLYVVLHSAGHDVFSCVRCTARVGNHDIYHAPDDFFALYVDCRANKRDWWWGGMHARDEGLKKRNSGGDPMPVEHRVIDTVKWVMEKYAIDPNRVYLSGNSMGASGTLGIGLRNGDLFAAVKANVPAGIEHVSQRMYLPPQSVPAELKLPDPPIVIDYSAPNDGWSFGHDRFVQAMNDRKYPLYFYWGPFGHANNHAKIIEVNDLINSFDWLQVKRNEAYAVFSNASCNDPLPWPDKLKEKAPGQVNAFFRWTLIKDAADELRLALFLIAEAGLETSFEIPQTATADVSLRRIQHLPVVPGGKYHWTYGGAEGEVTADAEGLITLPGLTITSKPSTLVLSRNEEPLKLPVGYELQYRWDFSDEASMASFELSDPAAWRLAMAGGRPVLELFRSSSYRYKVSSPQSIALLATRRFGDFVLECELRQTSKEYGHRDFCIFFGFQDPGHYYYAHFATKTDPRANQVFVVDEAPFTKISSKTNDGNPWGDSWHKVRVQREGSHIRVYFDDMSTPVMLAEDRRFGTGFLGFGSYNDTGMVANARIWAPKAQTEIVEKSGTLFKAEKD